MKTTTVVAEGLYFGEGPRWHDGKLWFSDFYDHAVKSLDVDGKVTTELKLDDRPSGLGWLPDGRLLVVSMQAQKLLRLDEGGLVLHSDLSEYATHDCNDMVVDASGRAWIGSFGFDLEGEVEKRGLDSMLADHPTTNIMRVDTDGSCHLAASDMDCPNGPVITPDGKTLIVAETLALRLTAFDIGDNGELSNRRVWARLGERAPDGICLDADGNVWIANCFASECVLIAQGGEVLDVVTTTQPCIAAMLGGEDGRELYMMTAPSIERKVHSNVRGGRVERVRVATPGAGHP